MLSTPATSTLSKRLARAVSILGHPLVLLPFSMLLLTSGSRTSWRLALGFAAFAVLVMAYSWWQVRRQRWAHVDASHRVERRALNRFLLVSLALAAPVAGFAGMHEAALGLGLSAAMVGTAMLTARCWKLSLHVAFAVFAAALLWRAGGWMVMAGLAFAALVAWSRLKLARHAPRDLVAGALTGALAGVAFWPSSAAIGG
jgi:membrane-associated phospholipid phosphatase